MYNLYYDHMFGWGFGGGLMMIVFWAVILACVIWLIRGLSGTHHIETHATKSALDLLKERYAKGEIDKKEFEEKKKDLMSM